MLGAASQKKQVARIAETKSELSQVFLGTFFHWYLGKNSGCSQRKLQLPGADLSLELTCLLQSSLLDGEAAIC